MRDLWKRIGWVAAYAVAMAYVEAAVVVYLRGLLNITNATARLDSYAGIEIGREAATLAMLAAVGWLAGRGWRERTAYAALAFGMWDMGYYLWLKLMIGWPVSFLSPDVLFLIPVRWTGPVLAPVLIALLMCFTALIVLQRLQYGETLVFPRWRLAIGLLGGLLALFVFMADALLALAGGHPDWNVLAPGEFRWPLFLLALAMMAAPAFSLALPRTRGLESIQEIEYGN
jgi:hypothetical protein